MLMALLTARGHKLYYDKLRMKLKQLDNNLL